MPLDVSKLSSSLKDVFASMPASASDAADGMSDAYYDYASDATAGGGKVAIPGANKSALAAALLAAIGAPAAGSPVSISGAWASGVAAFWIGVPVTGAQSGATVACPGAASLLASLTAIFANVANTADKAAAGVAAALDVATKTTTAAVAPPPGTTVTLL